MGPSLSVRPHMVTYLCLAAAVLGWWRTAQDGRPRWWLVPLSWVWANSHGMWFIGALLGLLVMVTLTLTAEVTRRSMLTRAWLVALAAVGVGALTPIGPSLLGAPFAVAGVGSFITEWQPPQFTSLGPALAIAACSFVVVGWARASGSTKWWRIAFLAFAVGWILLATRTVTIGAIVLTPLLAAALEQLNTTQMAKPRRADAAVYAAGLLTLLVALVAIPRVADEPRGFPAKLSVQLAQVPSGDLVLNDYLVGGWLRWRHPQVQPWVDGLTEAYSVAELTQYGDLLALGEDWQEVVIESEVNWALLQTDSPLANALVEQLGWHQLADDQGFSLLRAPSP
jgi:hypothetical protein